MSAAAVATTVATLSLSSLAQAQPGGVGPSCEVDANTPKEMFSANQAFQKAAAATDPAARQIALKAVMKQLTDKPDKFRPKNPLGYEMLLGQTLSLWIADEATPVVTTRGALGAVDTPDAPINLVQATDAAFDAVVAGSPVCESTVTALRQSEGWLAMTRKALDLSSGDADSARFYAQNSLTLLSDNNPYPYQVLGVVAQREKKVDEAISNWEKAIEAAGTDTTYSDIKQSSLYYVGMYSLQTSREQTGATQTASLNKAVGAMSTYLAEFRSASDAPTIMQGLGEAYLTMGDSAKVATIYAPILATPSAFDDFSLTMAGVLATQADRTDDAIALFEAAVAKNPNQRDALRNLAASYYTAEAFDKMTTPLDRLVAIDPNNVDAWSMYAFSAQGKMNAAKEAPIKKQWTDSLIYYAGKADSLPVKVTVGEFERREGSVSFTVVLEGNSDKPSANTLSVEFLDIAGNVVATASEEVPAIPKGESKSVQLKAEGSGIVAYRYKPLN